MAEKNKFINFVKFFAESEKDWEPRNQVPEESFKSEEGSLDIFNIFRNFLPPQCGVSTMGEKVRK